MSEPNELVDGYDPADPPQFGVWCAKCEHWEDDCRCPDPDEAPEPFGSGTVSITLCLAA